MDERMNSLVVRIPRSHLQALLDDPDSGLVIKEFEGKGHPDCIAILLKEEKDSVDGD